MCRHYDFAGEDLNPQFLYAYLFERHEEEKESQTHDFIHVVIILKGQGRVEVGDEIIEVEEGSVFIINPGCRHRTIPCGVTEECYLAFTNVQYMDCPKNVMPYFKGSQIGITMPEKMKKEIFRICREIEAEIKTPRCGQYFMMKAYLMQILCLLTRREELDNETGKRYTFRGTDKECVVKQIRQYFDEHYREKISLNQIASNMYLSPVYISKIFKNETGDTPINYLISLRMEKAGELLEKNPLLSVQKVADEVGYEDAYHFSKLFKKYHGISPVYYKGKKNSGEE